MKSIYDIQIELRSNVITKAEDIQAKLNLIQTDAQRTCEQVQTSFTDSEHIGGTQSVLDISNAISAIANIRNPLNTLIQDVKRMSIEIGL